MVDLLPSRTVPAAQVASLLRGRWMSLRTSRAFAPVTVGTIALLVTRAPSWIPSPWYDEAATISAATRSVVRPRGLLAVHAAPAERDRDRRPARRADVLTC